MSFSIIAAIGKNRELGKNGQLLWRLPKDLAFFKKTTLGHPIFMGRKTFESLPGVLPGRKHYVLSRHHQPKGETAASNEQDSSKTASVTYISNLPAFIAEHQDSPEEIFVIGGAMVYWEMLKVCNTLYLTEIDAKDTSADTFFPEFDKSKYQREELGEGEDNGVKFTFVRYTKI